jgi:glycosyltransferase involved in cell wall biosynthesis
MGGSQDSGGAPARISAAIICRDEADHIEECLRSVAWCDEVIVVDSGSTDGTVEKAERHATRVVHHPWEGFVAQKNFALGLAQGEWIFCLDADERCTQELRDAIRREIASPGETVGFEVRRHTFYLGRWINHGGWYPDRKLRVVRRARGRWSGIDPHDRLCADGPVRRIEADLQHYTYRDFAEQLESVQQFSDVVSMEWLREGRRFSLALAIVHPPVKFFECWLWKLGLLDGWPGFVIAATSAFYVLAKHVKLWERSRRARSLPPS